MSTINRIGSNQSLLGTSSADFITGIGSNLTVDAGAGNDTINVTGSNAKIYAGVGNDVISATGSNVVVDGGEGNDTLTSAGGNVSLSGGAGNDVLTANAGEVNVEGVTTTTLNGGAGSNTLTGSKYNEIFQYGNGNDVVFSYGAEDTVHVASGTISSVYASGGDVILKIGSNTMTIKDAASKYVTIKDSSGSVTTKKYGGESSGGKNITNYTANTLISGTSYNDTIYTAADKVTVRAGEGNDSINNSYSRGSADSVLVDGGAGSDIIMNTGKKTTLIGGAGSDFIYNYKTISDGNGNAVYDSVGTGVVIKAGDDNDYVYNGGPTSVSIDGGAGNDTVMVWYGGHNAIDGGAGSDIISLATGTHYDSANTIAGGAGNDSVYFDSASTLGNVYVYNSGDGFDVIYNASSKDTVSISGATYTPSTIGTSLVLSITGGGAITLNGASTNSPVIIIDDIYLTTGDDSVDINDSGVKVYALAGNDSIHVYGANDTIYGEAGKDYIWNFGVGAYIYGNEGDDTFDNRANNAQIYGGAGNDYFHNDSLSGGGENTSLYGEAGNDTMNNFVSNVTMIGGAGNDSLRNNRIGFSGSKTLYGGENVYMDGGEGDDYIYSDGRPAGGGKVTIRGGAGNDTIALANDSRNNLILFSPNEGSDVITGLDADDTISLSGYYTRETVGTDVVVSLLSGGSMTLTNASSKTINIVGGTLTVIGNGGKNISNSNANSVVNGTDYNDTISNSGSIVKVDAGAGDDYVSNSTGENITLIGGAGHDTIYDSFAEHIYIEGGSGNDSIYGNNNYATIDGGDGNDTIFGNHWRSSLIGGAGKDVISLTSYWYNTIDGGADNDTIIAGGSEMSINGGAGNDQFTLSGSNLTIDGGSGDDIISLGGSNNLIRYYDGGSDIIYGYNSSDSLSISGATYNVVKSGNNIKVNISGGNTITLVGAQDKTIWINGETVRGGSGFVTPQDVIRNFMGALDTVVAYSTSEKSVGEVALDNAINACSNKFSTTDEVINALIKDAKYYNSVDSQNGGKKFLLEKCGINFDNDDTGAITGYDAGASSIMKTPKSIIMETGTLVASSNTSFRAKSDSKDYGLTLSLGIDNPTKDMSHLWNCIENWWATESLQLIEDSYGYSFADTDSTVNHLSIQFTNNGDYKAATGYTPDGKSLRITLSLYHYNNFAANDYDGISPTNQNYLDRTFAHEMTHAIMMSKVYNFWELPQFLTEGMADLTHGTDDTRGSYMRAMASDPDSFQTYLNMTPGTGNNYYYAAGFVFLRYLAKQSSGLANFIPDALEIIDTGKKDIPNGISLDGDLLTASTVFTDSMIDLSEYDSNVTKVDASKLNKSLSILGNSSANLIKGSKGADEIFSGSGNDTLYGGAGNDVVSGGTGDDSITGDAGDDTLYGGAGKNTLTGGAGNDFFFYDGSNDLITDYETGKDKIKLSSASVTGSSLSGSNAILKTSTGNITVQGGAGKQLSILDKDDTAFSTVIGGGIIGITVKGATLTAGPTFTGNKIDLAESYASGATKVNASALSRGVSIIGTAAANSLKGGKGADTISGGSGNDTVSLGAGADVYIYSSGNDFIQDYVAGTDKIQLASATITGSSLSGSNVVLKTSGGNITVKSAKDKAITVIDAAGKETSQVYPTVHSHEGITVKGATLTAGPTFTGNKIDLAESYASGATKVNATVLSAGVSILGSAAANSVKGGKGSDTISGLAGNDTNYGGAGNDVIYGGAGNDKLYGDAGNDTLYGNAGNDTLTGGAGSDVFVYEAGNDVIADYVAGTDKIKLASASITGSSLSSSNVVLKTSSGNITVKSGKGKQLTIIDATGNETTQVYPSLLNYDANRTSVTLAAGFTGTLKAADYDSTVKKIDASAVTRAININGNAQANTIQGSAKVDTIYGAAGNDSISGAAGADKLFGDAGNDTLWGGAGNDTLTGGAGSDTFVYGASEGKDVIEDYTAGQDKIKISSGTISKTAYSGQNVVFTVGSGTLTVKNARGKSISIVDASGKTSTKTYTTGVSYGSNGNAEVPWFAEDDTNFVSGETQLDEISAENYSVTNFSVTNLENFAQLETPSLAAYSEK